MYDTLPGLVVKSLVTTTYVTPTCGYLTSVQVVSHVSSTFLRWYNISCASSGSNEASELVEGINPAYTSC